MVFNKNIAQTIQELKPTLFNFTVVSCIVKITKMCHCPKTYRPDNVHHFFLKALLPCSCSCCSHGNFSQNCLNLNNWCKFNLAQMCQKISNYFYFSVLICNILTIMIYSQYIKHFLYFNNDANSGVY